MAPTPAVANGSSGNLLAGVSKGAYTDIEDVVKQVSEQVLLGNYSDDVTALGTLAQLALSMAGLDLPMDIRDLTYDLTNWEWTPEHLFQTLTDAGGFLPLVGSLKYVDEAADLLGSADEFGDLLKNAPELGDLLKNTDEAVVGLIDSADEFGDFSKGADKIADSIDETFSPLNSGPLSDEVTSTFRSSTYTKRVLKEDTIFYRVYGGDAEIAGNYMSRTPQRGGMQSQLDLALNPEWGNTATNVTKVAVPRGTTI